VQRYLGQVSASLAGAGLSGVIGYFIATTFAGGSHATWPYFLLFGATFFGIIILYYQYRKSSGSSKAYGRRPKGHVFISYAHEDLRKVENLQKRLQASGLQVWRDKTNIWPGQDWQEEIRKAISDDALAFVACFSRNSLAKPGGYIDEELSLAIEQLTQRNPAVPWLFPVRFDNSTIPDLMTGPTRTLNSLQRADLFGVHRDDELERLIVSIKKVLDAPDEIRFTVSDPRSRSRNPVTALKKVKFTLVGTIAAIAAALMALIGAMTVQLPPGISIASNLTLDNGNYCKWQYGSRPIPIVKTHPLTIRIDNRCAVPAHSDATSDIPTTIFASADRGSEQVGNAVDGQALPVSCWKIGEEVSAAMAVGPTARSNLWLQVTLPNDVSGYLPDVRTGGGYTQGQLSGLGLRQCPA